MSRCRTATSCSSAARHLRSNAMTNDNFSRRWPLALAAGVAALLAAFAQAQPKAKKPNLSGMWQAANTANWNLETHASEAGPAAFGALLAVPPGPGVVVGGEIPYLPAALAQRNKNR